ncbi:hypothetical protein BD410DRAFT_796546 [Rickenella mellea]|uniref:F-box domain-containing protein n=1 Tax=Rickenella mellea TaxID=50990 RepID=A0A4Y7PLE6_9AGAM|nr:hypothetical protein BD410DRAFT_796546 [Rickenella mellea]
MTIVSYERYYNPELPWDYVSRLITGSKCSLKELELRTTRMKASSIVRCLQLSPDLKYIGITTDAELAVDEDRHLLPNLQTLRIFGADEY